MKYVPASLLLLTLTLLVGCAVGPRYAKPTVPTAPTDTFKEVDGWKTAQPSDQINRGKWWEVFGDPKLNALEEQVSVSNQDLKIAEARFREARALVRFNRSAEFPSISTAPGISAVRDSGHRPYFAATHNTGDFVLPFDLSYEVDLWGRVRRTVSAAREEAQATAGDLQTVNLSLHADLALDYFELRSADAQKQLLDGTVKAYADALQLTINRFDGGAAPKSDVAQAQTQLEAARVQQTDITVQRAQFEHAIAVLIGKPPAAFRLEPITSKFQPPDLSVGLPSQLLERRPDIAAAERRVAEATVAGYRQTALTAFQEVEDNLAALRILDQEAQQQTVATASAQESLQIFTNRYIGGADPYLQVLTAQTIALQNERNDVDILRRRMDASVLLIKALGGGWNVSELPKTVELR